MVKKKFILDVCCSSKALSCGAALTKSKKRKDTNGWLIAKAFDFLVIILKKTAKAGESIALNWASLQRRLADTQYWTVQSVPMVNRPPFYPPFLRFLDFQKQVVHFIEKKPPKTSFNWRNTESVQLNSPCLAIWWKEQYFVYSAISNGQKTIILQWLNAAGSFEWWIFYSRQVVFQQWFIALFMRSAITTHGLHGVMWLYMMLCSACPVQHIHGCDPACPNLHHHSSVQARGLSLSASLS